MLVSAARDQPAAPLSPAPSDARTCCGTTRPRPLARAARCPDNEPEEILNEALELLASHTYAKSYMVVLALEAGAPGDVPAFGARVCGAHERHFHGMFAALHPRGIAGEMPGKSANVNWAVRAAHSELCSQGVPMERVCITVMDTDTHMMEEYLNTLAVRYFDSPLGPPGADGTHAIRERFFGCPASFKGTTNDSSLSRIGDYCWAASVLQNLASNYRYKFPCSTYSLGMELAERCGFWDVGIESVPEDMHMAIKLYGFTDGRAELEPIYFPISSQHVSGEGFWGTTMERFSQAKRHMWAATEVAYTMELFVRRARTMPWWARVRLLATVFNAHFLPTTGLFLASVSAFIVMQLSPLSPLGTVGPAPCCMTAILREASVFGGVVNALNALALVYACEAGWASLPSYAREPAGAPPARWRPLRQIIEWLWLPVCNILFVFIPCVWAQTRLCHSDSMRPSVSKKAVTAKPASAPSGSSSAGAQIGAELPPSAATAA